MPASQLEPPAIPEIGKPIDSAAEASPVSAPQPPATPEPVTPVVTNLPPSTGTPDIVPLPTAGSGRTLDKDPFAAEPPPIATPPARIEPEQVVNAPTLSKTPAPASAPALAAPRIVRCAAKDREPDRAAPVSHIVQSGENFWTISKTYYSSGRYYKALWWANRREVPKIDELYVNQTIRIPPPEDLDPTRVEPVTAAVTKPVQVRKVSRPPDLEMSLPSSDAFAKRKSDFDDTLDPDPKTAASTRYRPRGPLYKVRANDTLRSIARDTLGTSRRADEILEKNSDVIDDPNNLIVGQVLEMPDDAKVGRARR